MTTRCSGCGHANDEGVAFCANCNRFLAWSSEPADDTGVSSPLPRKGQQAAPAPETTPFEPQPSVPVPRSSGNVPDGAVPGLLDAIAQSQTLAGKRSRDDLSERLEHARERLQGRTVTVAVVGEFKRGKSTLVNALIQTAACPADADIVTAVPTLVRYGDQVAVTAYEQAPDGSRPIARPASPSDLAQLVSEADERRGTDVLSVEIEVPHRILRSGLRLLDTPGVGGLESAHGQVALASLASVDALLFVTDASQELTGPELDFLRSALQRCPTAAFVVTKTDLHRQWRRIVELDAAHLAAAGMDIPVIAVSSFLRLRATRHPELNSESGFGALVEFLAKDVVQGSAKRAAGTLAHEVDFVTTQLAHESDVERVVLERPQEGAALVKRLDQASRRARKLSAPDATWQQILTDGVQDLVADIEYDLQARLRTVLRDVRDIIDRTDPKTTWTETEAWLRREVAAAGVSNHDLLIERASDLAESVATQFNLESGEAVELELDVVTRALEQHHLPSAASLSMPGGRLASLVITARTTALIPMLAYSIVSTAVPPFLLIGAATVLGIGIGTKLFRDESKRQRSYRQGQAKAAVGKFVDEVAFEMNKETRDALRRTQRQLRDEFNARARSLHASANGALRAAQEAAVLTPAGRAVRAAEVDEETARLGAIRSTLRELSVAGAATHAGAGRG